MTDTHTFWTWAIDRKTGETKKFIGLNHHLRAIIWLRNVK